MAQYRRTVSHKTTKGGLNFWLDFGKKQRYDPAQICKVRQPLGESIGRDVVSNREDSVSIVVPLYNEEDCVEELHQRLKAVMDATGRRYELVLVNDGSSDGTLGKLSAIQRGDPAVKLVNLAGNSGQTPALAAGFDHAVGDVVIPMDGDLQHLPEEIPLFLEKIDEGYQVVSGWRQKRKESYLIRLVPSLIANKAMSLVSGIPLHDFGTTFKAYRREILDRICLYGQFHRFIPVLAKPLKARMCEIPIAAPARTVGTSKYGIGRTYTVLFDIIRIKFLTSFISRPLQFFGALGFVLVASGGIMSVVLIKDKYLNQMEIMTDRGPFFIATVFLLMAGLQMFSIGFLGEMMTRFHHETGHAKLYSVKSVMGKGLDDADIEA